MNIHSSIKYTEKHQIHKLDIDQWSNSTNYKAEVEEVTKVTLFKKTLSIANII